MERITENLYISDAEALLNLETDHKFNEVISLGHRTHLGLGEADPSTTGDRFVFTDGPPSTPSLKLPSTTHWIVSNVIRRR